MIRIVVVWFSLRLTDEVIHCLSSSWTKMTTSKPWFWPGLNTLWISDIKMLCVCWEDFRTLLCCLFQQQFHMESVSSCSCRVSMQTRCSLLFHPAVNLALGPVSFSPVKMWDPGLWGLQTHADQGCFMHFMFSHGSCVWVRHLAGQLDKQRCTLHCVLNQRPSASCFNTGPPCFKHAMFHYRTSVMATVLTE